MVGRIAEIADSESAGPNPWNVLGHFIETSLYCTNRQSLVNTHNIRLQAV